ncbi:MAG: hypothetical protein A3J74_05435 [Elusimicrobia bacterium RIFCSPHIGHO2_02_FULL_57_9]|nr:MAG: hypothetical protein A3J74_05435 [Elusimicrobia bacterium RIFCSPHIGHO2_02_FULL_57_9]
MGRAAAGPARAGMPGTPGIPIGIGKGGVGPIPIGNVDRGGGGVKGGKNGSGGRCPEAAGAMGKGGGERFVSLFSSGI